MIGYGNGTISAEVDTSASSPSSDRNSSPVTRSIQDILQFKKRHIHGHEKVRTLVPQHLLSDDTQGSHDPATESKLYQIRNYQKHYLKNGIRTTKYTVLSFIPKNLFEQFHRFANCYFVFIIALNFIPQIGAIQPYLSMVPVICILLVQAIKDLAEDYGRYRNDIAVNCAKAKVNLSSDNKYHVLKWQEIQVGDVVRVMCNDVIPADLLLLHSSDVDGRCFIETSNIDGETNLKQRTVVKRHWGHSNPNEFRPTDFKSIIECQAPNNEIYKFHGNIIPPDNSDKIAINNNNLLLRGCVLRNTDYVEGIVIYAGHETKAMLNNNGPRHKRSKLERRMNTDVIYCVILLIVMCLIGAVGNGLWAGYQNAINQTELFIPREEGGNQLDAALSGFYMFWTMVILLQVLIPISLYVSMELVKSAQVFMINNDRDLYHEESNTPMRCRALNITEDLGQIQFVFSDKTGTLTENQMVFRRCTVGGVDYPHAANAARIENLVPTPHDINPVYASTHEESHHFIREETSRQSYRRPHSGSIKPHHRRNLSTVSKQQVDAAVEETDVHQISRSAPSSPSSARRNKASTRRPAAYHRRNISSVSAKEVIATIAAEDEEQIVHEAATSIDDQDLETDVTPDPTLYDQFMSIENPAMQSGDASVKMSIKKNRILDFFINLAICNTVVLSTDVEETREANSKFLLPPSGDRYSTVSSNDSTPDAAHKNIGKKLSVGKNVHFENGNTNNCANVDQSQQHDRFTKEALNKIRYEAESPDEAALVYAARAYGCVLAHRSCTAGEETVTITLPNGQGTMVFQVLHKLPFDSVRKRMSVIVRDPISGEITLYCKGADTAILSQLSQPSRDVQFDVQEHITEDIACKPGNSPDIIVMTKKYLDAYARTGLRTMCLSKRVLSSQEYSDWLVEYQEADGSLDDRDQLVMNCFYKMETKLELLGATGIEDRLQEGVPDTIESLRQAGMQVWVLTGDKQETAINIGYSCRLIHLRDEVIILNADNKEALLEILEVHIKEQEQKRGKHPADDSRSSILNSFNISFVLANSTRFPAIDDNGLPALVLVIDGKTLAFALDKEIRSRFVRLASRCRSVLCCRTTPLQKGEVVKLIKDELKVMTLAIGDGANDVSMIQVADVGIGLSGQEGMQAVMSSDYAIAQFRFLKKLLLVHGHWNYARLASMVLYFFYKNAAFVFLIFWYQLYCGFSGGNMIDDWYLLLFNLIFTSVPPLVNGVLDKDISEGTLLRKPSLYKQGIKDELYLQRTFFINILDAVYQSIIIFFLIYSAYRDSIVARLEWGTVVTSSSVFIILIHLGIETKTWTWIHWVCQIGSVVVFFAFALIYNGVSPTVKPYFIMERVIQTGNFWFSILLVTAVALFPRYAIRAIQSNVFPTECQRERILEMTKKVNSPPTTVSTSLATSSATSNSSTYQNPTYRSPPSAFTPSTSNVTPSKRPAALPTAPGMGRGELARDALYIQYGGSTPDLSLTSPYYSSHNTNVNNSNLAKQNIYQIAVDEKHAVANHEQDNTSYLNSAYYGLDDDFVGHKHSDAGEGKVSGSTHDERRNSVMLALENPFYMGDSSEPQHSTFLKESGENIESRTELTSGDVPDVTVTSSHDKYSYLHDHPV